MTLCVLPVFSASLGEKGGREDGWIDGWMPPLPGDEGVTGSGGEAAAATAAAAGTCWLSRSSVTKHVLAGWSAGRHSALLDSAWRSAANTTPPRSKNLTSGGGGFRWSPPRLFLCNLLVWLLYFPTGRPKRKNMWRRIACFYQLA